MNDLWSYSEAERIADVADAVGELNAVYSYRSRRQHVVAPRTIFRTTSRTEADFRETSIAIAVTKVYNKVEIVAALLIAFQSRRIAVLMELKLELNGALSHTLVKGIKELAIKLTTRCKRTYRFVLLAEKQRKEWLVSSYSTQAHTPLHDGLTHNILVSLTRKTLFCQPHPDQFVNTSQNDVTFIIYGKSRWNCTWAMPLQSRLQAKIPIMLYLETISFIKQEDPYWVSLFLLALSC